MQITQVLNSTRSLPELWRKPWGKPIVIAVGLFLIVLAIDTIFLSGQNIHYGSHPLREPVVFDVDTADVTYRAMIFVGNKKSKYRLQYTLSGPDGNRLVNTKDGYGKNKRSFTFVGDQTGPHELRVSSASGSGPHRVMVSIYENDRSILPSWLKPWRL